MSGQRNTPETLAVLRNLSLRGDSRWRALCLKLCRSARNLPAVYPSALAAQVATPMSERVYDLDKVRPGMVAYSDDPNDSNKWGHIYTIRARTAENKLVVWTNDALRTGKVDTVDIDWFRRNWGDKFQFAATSLNGFDLLLPATKAIKVPAKHPKPPTQPKPKADDTNVDYALHRLDKAIAYHESKGHDYLVRLIKKERADLVALRDIITGKKAA